MRVGRRGRCEPGRILVLVPHEPLDDPRVTWVTNLCASIGPTEVYGLTFSTERQAREYDGTTYLERVNVSDMTSLRALRWSNRLARLMTAESAIRYLRRDGLPPTLERRSRLARFRAEADHQVGAVRRFAYNATCYHVLIEALVRRAQAVSVPPSVAVCHDVFALAAGLRLKDLFGTRIVYDSHEYWPAADLVAQPWEHWLMGRYERRLIRQADVVVTVSPQLASRLEHRYGLRGVLTVPNAMPWQSSAPELTAPVPSSPIRFLVQGRVAPRRGFEEFLAAWRNVAADSVRLYLRCPPNEHLTRLRSGFADLEASGRLEILPPVAEHELVDGAAFADVGVITYGNTSENHMYACPNKLSQYMQAGLAVLSTDLPFVRHVVSRAECGLTFDESDPGSLAEAVRRLVSDGSILGRMKANARRAARDWYNWEAQSRQYRAAVAELAGASQAV